MYCHRFPDYTTFSAWVLLATLQGSSPLCYVLLEALQFPCGTRRDCLHECSTNLVKKNYEYLELTHLHFISSWVPSCLFFSHPHDHIPVWVVLTITHFGSNKKPITDTQQAGRKDDFILVSLSNTPQKAIRIQGKRERKYAQASLILLY
jgi:hypothetical protein